MAGNVWEWVSDWYDKNYYSNRATLIEIPRALIMPLFASIVAVVGSMMLAICAGPIAATTSRFARAAIWVSAALSLLRVLTLFSFALDKEVEY